MIERIRSPLDVRAMPPEDLPTLAGEIRDFLVDRVCRSGGHLGPNLGAVELSIALHRVFDSPAEPIMWDTGHQAYVHKLLTGRAAGFDRLRRRGGLSGYPSRAESEHDVIENSHASTALSYADGIAKAARVSGRQPRPVVAVVGDGALTGGMAWEALNNIAASRLPVVIVLNDNGRSYAPTIGGLADHLSALRGARARCSLFEELGIRYLGPVDGHDIAAVESALRTARENGGPVVVHCLTTKGRGYDHAERHELDRHHAVPVTDPATGRQAAQRRRSWTDVFADEIVRIGAERPDVVAVSAAMVEPAGLHPFQRRFPERLFDVGIAEQHAVTSAAGLALGGLHPVVCVYSTFLTRALDQVLMDVALHRCPVTFVLDRAGVTGDDGPSHNGMWDLSILNVVPGLAMAAPRDGRTLRAALREAVAIDDGPTAIRYPKGAVGPDLPAVDTVNGVDILHRDADPDVLFVSVGAMADTCVRAARLLSEHGIATTVADPRWIKPVNPALTGLAARHTLVVTVEDCGRSGGFGSALTLALRDAGVTVPIHCIGLPQRFLDQGLRAEVLEECGLTPQQIVRNVAGTMTRPGTRNHPELEPIGVLAAATMREGLS
ncbi:1-deoxy-D-xylulose-5-phosphate synthase [Sphaerisporangium sp. B11E5]|uniref:1-deoxy-D-xylulose-5-phosphate synthase n=1 Tax=Sphaerisporangium sp. B11E5 TaxID=3153563 RepID=UPI00325E084A